MEPQVKHTFEHDKTDVCRRSPSERITMQCNTTTLCPALITHTLRHDTTISELLKHFIPGTREDESSTECLELFHHQHIAISWLTFDLSSKTLFSLSISSAPAPSSQCTSSSDFCLSRGTVASSLTMYNTGFC